MDSQKKSVLKLPHCEKERKEIFKQCFSETLYYPIHLREPMCQTEAYTAFLRCTKTNNK